jgi:hypothetical protein
MRAIWIAVGVGLLDMGMVLVLAINADTAVAR